MRKAILIVTMCMCAGVYAQTAEERIKVFVDTGDIQGLAAYCQSVVDNSRTKTALIDKQTLALDQLQRNYDLFESGLFTLKEQLSSANSALSMERLERQRMVDLMLLSNRNSWKSLITSAATGSVVGFSASKGAASWGIVGAAIGFGGEWISQLVTKKKVN